MILDDIKLVDVLGKPQQENDVPVDVHATLICPVCEEPQKVVMPIEGQQHYYKCTNTGCLADLAPTQGNDCVFCSYADKPCPPKQKNPNLGKKELHSLI